MDKKESPENSEHSDVDGLPEVRSDDGNSDADDIFKNKE